MKEYSIKKIIIITVASTIGGVFGVKIVNYFMEKHNQLDKSLMLIANETNKELPKIIDQDTQFDNTIVLPNKTFQYNYTLINYVKDQVDIKQLKSQLSSQILCTASGGISHFGLSI